MRWVGLFVRLIGWLLTPLVVWAASVFGAWLLFLRSPHFADPLRALLVAFGFSVLCGAGILLLWMQLLRRSPRLRHSLHVTSEGLPEVEPAAPDPQAQP
jgi:hypothetical protein